MTKIYIRYKIRNYILDIIWTKVRDETTQKIFIEVENNIIYKALQSLEYVVENIFDELNNKIFRRNNFESKRRNM